MTIKEQILKQLRESDGFVSGEELSARLKVSRTAVWKSINALRDVGYEIESSTNRGYLLKACPDILTAEEIEAGLETEYLGRKAYCHESLDSTNEEAKRQGLRGAENGSLFIAEEQVGGKGRLGRTFVSPPGTGLWFTILLRPGMIPVHVSLTTLMSGMAVCRAIRSLSGCPALIKWPNDIIIGEKKVCGILTEMSAEIDRIEFLAVGIGINVNNTAFPENIRQKATSLLIESGKPLRRIRLLQEILRNFESLLKANLLTTGNSFLTEYRELCVTLNRKVSFFRKNKSVTGTAVDISPEGELLVRMEDGTVETVFAGEVSVQGIYGQKL